MKQIQIGKKNYSRIENSLDCNILRFTEFQKYVTAMEWGDSPAALRDKLQKFQQGFDDNKRNECFLALNDMVRCANAISEGKPYLHYLFALIVLNEEENQNPERIQEFLTQGYLDGKLDKWAKAGLTNRQVAEELANFTQASPESFPLDFLMTLERLTKWLNSAFADELKSQSSNG